MIIDCFVCLNTVGKFLMIFQIFLVYEKDLRTAIISISRKRSGADTILAVAPRAQ